MDEKTKTTLAPVLRQAIRLARLAKEPRVFLFHFDHAWDYAFHRGSFGVLREPSLILRRGKDY